MKSRFVIKTEEQVLAANGAIVPPVSIEVEAEYNLSDAAGMYELYKKVLKELPGIKADMKKIFAGFNVAKWEEKEEEHKAQMESKSIIGIIERRSAVYIVKCIDGELIKTIYMDSPVCWDNESVSKVIRYTLNLLEKDEKYYLCPRYTPELGSQIIDYVDEHSSLIAKFDKGFNNCRKGRVQFIPAWVNHDITNIESSFL